MDKTEKLERVLDWTDFKPTKTVNSRWPLLIKVFSLGAEKDDSNADEGDCAKDVLEDAAPSPDVQCAMDFIDNIFEAEIDT